MVHSLSVVSALLCVGPLPPEIGLLQNLTSLELFENKLAGRDFHFVPAPFRRWWSNSPAPLFVSVLSWLGIGTIPPQIGQLFHLQELNLWRNRLAGHYSCILLQRYCRMSSGQIVISFFHCLVSNLCRADCGRNCKPDKFRVSRSRR